MSKRIQIIVSDDLEAKIIERCKANGHTPSSFGRLLFEQSLSKTDYTTTIQFDPAKIDVNGLLMAEGVKTSPVSRSYLVNENDGFKILDFNIVNGGFCLTKDTVKVQTTNDKLKELFPTLKNETVKRLAHKGIFPIKSTGGYLYFTDKDNKLIGTANIDELGQLLIDSPLIENKHLKRAEWAELKYFGLL